MNKDNSFDCIDAGTENCPCYLALTGDCLMCTRLQGKDCCDCNWKGVCIYNEFIQGNCKVNNPRRDFEAAIVDKKYYTDDLVIFVIQVDKGFALKTSKPGSYLFIRGSNQDSFYDTPISVMKADAEKGYLHLAVKSISAKTKSILDEDEKLIIRGPYRNGIQGIREVFDKKNRHNKTLVIAKGIGIAPGLLLADYFNNLCQVDFIVDTEKISKEFVKDYLSEGSSTVKYMNLNELTAQGNIKNILIEKKYETVLILASDYFVETLGPLVRDALKDAVIAVSNNFHICCGEGLCGACSCIDNEGRTIKMCKCQMKQE
ncbi:hypothetical protein [Anaerovorax odorimutans]|uniref:hypothetical protein n=1 Tax=Anaerovorax odorimutans TaxID=109327 RepID=UPI0004853124|nr:hypothetical protein [Anaerovorax odorimutans]